MKRKLLLILAGIMTALCVTGCVKIIDKGTEGKYTGEGNITYKGEKGKEGFTKVQIVEDTVEDKKESNSNNNNNKEETKEESKENKEVEENKEEKKENSGGFKKIQIVEED